MMTVWPFKTESERFFNTSEINNPVSDHHKLEYIWIFNINAVETISQKQTIHNIAFRYVM
jgi:hypothetical protein